jgi:hypothetical protein
MAKISREKEEDINTKIGFKQTNMKRKLVFISIWCLLNFPQHFLTISPTLADPHKIGLIPRPEATNTTTIAK